MRRTRIQRITKSNINCLSTNKHDTETERKREIKRKREDKWNEAYLCVVFIYFFYPLILNSSQLE